jgi:hypothetical protein
MAPPSTNRNDNTIILAWTPASVRPLATGLRSSPALCIAVRIAI